MKIKKKDPVILIDINHCINSIKKGDPNSRDSKQPDILFNPVTQGVFEGTLLIDTCDLDDLAPYSIGTREWIGVIQSGVPKNQYPDRVLKYVVDKYEAEKRNDTLFYTDCSGLHKQYALNLVKKGDLYYKLDADAPYTGPIYHVHWGYTSQLYYFAHEDGDGGLKEVQKDIKAELGERIELFKDEYVYFDGVGGEFFKLTIEKAGQFKNGKLEGTYKEYDYDEYPGVYTKANYPYHQGLLHGIALQGGLDPNRGSCYEIWKTIEFDNGLKNGFQKHYGYLYEEERTYTFIDFCSKFKKGKLIEEISDEETLKKLFPDEFSVEFNRPF